MHHEKKFLLSFSFFCGNRNDILQTIEQANDQEIHKGGDLFAGILHLALSYSFSHHLVLSGEDSNTEQLLSGRSDEAQQWWVPECHSIMSWVPLRCPNGDGTCAHSWISSNNDPWLGRTQGPLFPGVTQRAKATSAGISYALVE